MSGAVGIKTDDQWNATYEDARARMISRLRQSIAEPLAGWPDHADPKTGKWITKADGDCTGGFFAGWLWLAGRQYPDLLPAARQWGYGLKRRLQSKTHYRGMLFYQGVLLGRLLHGEDEARELTIAVARALADDFNKAAGVIGLGEEGEETSNLGPGETTVDAIGMIVACLTYAANETDDERLREMARSHALKHIDWCVRQDGSACQSASFDVDTGALTRRYTHKGYSPESTWGRAQAWSMLGYALAALWQPEEPLFLKTAQRIADWWIANVPADGISYWDFGDPRIPNTWRDTSAPAMVSAALFKIAGLTKEKTLSAKYRTAAEHGVRTMVWEWLTPLGPGETRPEGMLIGACYHPTIGHAVDCEAVWPDYYLFESLEVLTGRLGEAQI
jgi:unsaturated chondroitin disaccharide hydrolase